MGLTEPSSLWLRQAAPAGLLVSYRPLACWKPGPADLALCQPVLESNSKNVIHTNIYKTSHADDDDDNARRSRRVPIVRTHRAERLAVQGPRRTLGNGLAEVVREIGHERHELERLDDVEGAVAVMA